MHPPFGNVTTGRSANFSVSANQWTDIVTKTFTPDEYGIYIVFAYGEAWYGSTTLKQFYLLGAKGTIMAQGDCVTFGTCLCGIAEIGPSNPTIKLRCHPGSAAATVANTSNITWIKIA